MTISGRSSLISLLDCLPFFHTPFLSLLFVGVPPIAPPPTISLKARLTPLTQPLFLLALLPTALCTLGGFTIYTYINPFFQQTTHVTDPSILLLLYGIR